MTLLTIIAVGSASCTASEPELPDEGEMTLSLSSPIFQEGEDIPITYTCDGQDISPPLTWGEPPSETQSFALIMDDPDAPGGLLEAVPTHNELANGALQGKNGFGNIGYGGPCPPSGPAHHYRFSIYALDQALDLTAGASRKQVIDVITGHILAWGQLTGTYQR
jgi:Raf kinase inhibitor-like YbhB/YbcL family protein